MTCYGLSDPVQLKTLSIFLLLCFPCKKQDDSLISSGGIADQRILKSHLLRFWALTREFSQTGN